MKRRYSGLEVIAVVVLAFAIALSGCAKRPGMSAESVPSPGVGPGSGMDGGRPTDVVPAKTEQSEPATLGYGAGRPSPKDFVAVADLRDIHFDFDRSDVRPDMAPVLDGNAEWLNANPGHVILIEGHADERGTGEYNLALGDRRAKSSMNYLVSRGVRASRISIISYGEDRPLCRAQDESCWKQNRRAHFVVKPQ